MLAVAALAGCSSAPTAGSGAARSTAPSADSGTALAIDAVRAVTAADDLVFANRYADADAAFVALIHGQPGNGLAHAHYALFLNYRQEFAAAHAEAAQAVDVAPGLARAHAVLCRVDDWANHLDAAVAEGRRAVQIDSSDVLAHLFLSEALADRGDYPGSRTELGAARGLITESSSAYEKAEVHREEGNLGHDAGDLAAQLAGFVAAYQAQPDWVERPSELAGAYLDNSDLVGAHNAVEKALALTPDDPDLLATLGRVALFQPDYAAADQAFGRLARLRPTDSASLELAAHALFADKQDIDGAVALLERAITASPSNEEATAYLVYLERDVRDDEARGHREAADAVAAARGDLAPGARAPSAPDIAAVQAVHAQAALDEINTARRNAGLAAVTLDAHLSTSAITHCFYWLFNNASPSVAKLGIHLETPGLPGFSGVHAPDRAVNFGWHNGPVGEDITHAGDPALAVGQWVNSVYHRFPIMRPDLSAIGYADCAVGSLPMEDMEFGFGIVDTMRHAPIPFPGDGQVAVPDIFSDNELPDPVPAGKPRTTGYPVTVTFDPLSRAQVSSFTVAGPDGKALDGYALAPDRLDGNAATLLPVAPLAAKTTYTSHITASVDGRAYDQTWSFTTA